jgi:hypothetical protein
MPIDKQKSEQPASDNPQREFKAIVELPGTGRAAGSLKGRAFACRVVTFD